MSEFKTVNFVHLFQIQFGMLCSPLKMHLDFLMSEKISKVILIILMLLKEKYLQRS